MNKFDIKKVYHFYDKREKLTTTNKLMMNKILTINGQLSYNFLKLCKAV